MIAAIVSAALSALIVRCAPRVGSTTMSAIVAYESGGRPYAIGDNSARASYFPSDRPTAIAIARTLLRSGHDIDVGYAQINARNFRSYGLDAASALDPCTNVATASRILSADYAGAARAFGPGQRALTHALSAYNTGGYFAGLSYARGVYATAATLRWEGPRRPGRAAYRASRTFRAFRAVPFYRASDERTAR